MPCAIRCHKNLSEKATIPADEKMELIGLLVEDTSVLANICERILGGACEQELPLSTIARLNLTLSAISSIATNKKQNADLIVVIAKEVENALSKICSLCALVIQTGDETRLSCMPPMLAFGTTLNKLYREMGCAIGV
jgi:hypothetical protein